MAARTRMSSYPGRKESLWLHRSSRSTGTAWVRWRAASGGLGRSQATIEHMFAWMEQLNEAQRAAVSHDGRALRVLAGAGTGKTTTLSARVAWLLANGTPPERILLLTFTRRAARQMFDRTGAMLATQRRDGRSDPTINRVMGGTFHAVAHRTLRRYSQA